MCIKGARPHEARIAPHLLVSDGERALQFYATAFAPRCSSVSNARVEMESMPRSELLNPQC
jgi:predicted enzyme related to lactoylglutathione lyase